MNNELGNAVARGRRWLQRMVRRQSIRGVIYMDSQNAVVLIHGRDAVAALRAGLNNLLPDAAASAGRASESREPRSTDTAQQSRSRRETTTRRLVARGKRLHQP